MTALERAPAGRGRDLPPGTVLNGYRIERCIGDGGFGVSYLVRDMLNQVFALKEYFPEQFGRRVGLEIVPISDEDAPLLEELRKRFIDEALGLVRLGRVMQDDDSIVKVRTCFEANRTAYMVMEYVEGESLEDALRRSPSGLPDRTLRDLIVALLNGLQLVHDAGILHRDIKPSNIILRPDGRPVLIDFGSAREMRGGGLDYTRLFSALYAPTEQVLGQQQGPYSDLYAVGAIGYRAIGGNLEDAPTRLGALQEGRPDPMPPSTKVGAGRYDPSLLTTLDRVLAVEAKQRLPTATAMLAALSALPNTRRVRTKRSLLVVGAMAAGVAGLLGSALFVPKLLYKPPPPPPDLGASVAALAARSSCALLFQSVAQDGTVWLRAWQSVNRPSDCVGTFKRSCRARSLRGQSSMCQSSNRHCVPPSPRFGPGWAGRHWTAACP